MCLLMAGSGLGVAPAAAEPTSTAAGSMTLQPTIIYPPDGARDIEFGRAVAVDGDTMVVGAPCDPTRGGVCDGSVYVLVQSGGTWAAEAKIVPIELERDEAFGTSVDISGDTIIVGAPRSGLDGAEVGPGRAFVFVRSGTTWTTQAVLNNDVDREENVGPSICCGLGEFFGASVAIDGETLVVGAPEDDIGDKEDAGSATVFERSGTTWQRLPTLTAPAPSNNASLGTSVDVQGDTVVVGASQGFVEGVGRYLTGVVYVYVRSEAGWTTQAQLSTETARNVGTSVSLDGSTLAVGTGRKVAVATRSGDRWTPLETLSAVPDGRPAEHLTFGQSVALSGRTLVTGAPSAKVDNVQYAGAAYEFVRAGGSWTQVARVTDPAPKLRDNFGTSVAADSGIIVVGGYFGLGSVFVYACGTC